MIDHHQSNWFERNSKKTLFVTFLLLLALMLFSAEKFTAKLNKISNKEDQAVKRYIRLREREPYLKLRTQPSLTYINERTDGLVDKAYLLRTNENSFVLPQNSWPDPDVKIVFLGGSTTECLYVNEENRFPYATGKLLEKNLNIKVNSYNNGCEGNNSLDTINSFINKVFPLEPDIAVFMHNVNDFSVLLHYGTYWNDNPSRSPIITLKKEALKPPKLTNRAMIHLYNACATHLPNLTLFVKEFITKRRFSEDEFADVRGEKKIVNQPLFKKEFSKNLRTFINLCRARGITPVLMTQENRVTDTPDKAVEFHSTIFTSLGISYKEYKETYDMFNETIREVGAESNALVIDLDRKIPKNKEYIYDGYHFNDKGSLLAAEVIADELGKIINVKGK